MYPHVFVPADTIVEHAASRTCADHAGPTGAPVEEDVMHMGMLMVEQSMLLPLVYPCMNGSHK